VKLARKGRGRKLEVSTILAINLTGLLATKQKGRSFFIYNIVAKTFF